MRPKTQAGRGIVLPLYMGYNANMEALSGAIESVIFRNEDNGWTVLELSVSLGGMPGLITATGVTPMAAPGMPVTLYGDWTEHREYGMQFKFSSMDFERPEDEEGTERFLASGLIKGVGPATAKNIVKMFGKDTLRVIEEEPELLAKVKGVSMRKAMEIAESYCEQAELRTAVSRLTGYGITTNQAVALYKQFGDGVIDRIETDPYSLIDQVEGIGFLRADRIAMSVGIERESPFRIEAGISYALNRAANDGGHTCLPCDRLCAYAAELLNCEQELVEEALERLLMTQKLRIRTIDGRDMVFLPVFYACEAENAYRLKSLLDNGQAADRAEAERELDSLEHYAGIVLDPIQRQAVLCALSSGVMVVTGGPGTGKTTIMEFVLALLDKMGYAVELCAPTGRAAKRLGEATGREAMTVHRLLEYNGDSFVRCEDFPLDCDVCIVDEASMMDSLLMFRLLKALKEGARLLLVGDADQLPSVGAGNVLRDIIASGAVPVVRLTEIFRTGKRSRIAENARRINQGQMPLLEFTDDFAFEQKSAAEDVADRVVAMCKNRRLGDVFADLQVLSPTKKGLLGVKNLNLRLQEAMNPPAKGKKEQTFGETLFRVGDKVMQVKNNYKLQWTGPSGSEGSGVFNGDMGVIVAIHTADRQVEVRFDDQRTAFYEYPDMSQLELAYCVSVHKSQGSEFPVVLLPIWGGPPQLLTRNLLYTAVTRARNRVVIVGRASAVKGMVDNDNEMTRYSALKALLQALP